MILSLIGYFSTGAGNEESEPGPAIKVLKLVTTTALGFVFAKTEIAAQHDKSDNASSN